MCTDTKWKQKKLGEYSKNVLQWKTPGVLHLHSSRIEGNSSLTLQHTKCNQCSFSVSLSRRRIKLNKSLNKNTNNHEWYCRVKSKWSSSSCLHSIWQRAHGFTLLTRLQAFLTVRSGAFQEQLHTSPCCCSAASCLQLCTSHFCTYHATSPIFPESFGDKWSMSLPLAAAAGCSSNTSCHQSSLLRGWACLGIYSWNLSDSTPC